MGSLAAKQPHSMLSSPDGGHNRFDLQFVRQGTDVVLGSIPVVLGTAVAGEGYTYDELEDGEIHRSSHFGNYIANVARSSSLVSARLLPRMLELRQSPTGPLESVPDQPAKLVKR